MKSNPLRRAAAPMLALVLAFSLALPTSAFFWSKKADAPYVADFSKNGLIGSVISFSPQDFVVKPDSKTALSGITIDALPDPGAGSLCVGDQPVVQNTHCHHNNAALYPLLPLCSGVSPGHRYPLSSYRNQQSPRGPKYGAEHL